MNFFNLTADPFSLSQAMAGRPTYQQQVSTGAGQILQGLGSKIPGQFGQIAQRVGQAVSAVGSAPSNIRIGPSITYKNPQGQYVTHSTFALESGGLIPGRGKGSLAPWYHEKGGMIQQKKKSKNKSRKNKK